LRDGCASDIAAKRSDPAVCGSIATPGLRDSCDYKVAEKTGDTSLCYRIADAGLKSDCSGGPVMVE